MTKIDTRNPSGGLFGRTRSILMGGGAVAALALTPGTAFAQDADEAAEEDVNELPVILVTARKQVETLQEVPVTITSVGGELLDKYNVDQVADVVNRVPTLNVQVGGSGSGGQLSLRGVGSSNISAAFDSAVAFDFDGVVVSSMRLVQAGFFDTQQIDVLKGPQSLFFGKSASAGVFSIKSANPTPTWEIGGKASYEFEEKGYTIQGYISGPISDTVGIRVAAQYNDIKDYVELQDGTPTAHGDSRGMKNFVGRVTLAWEPDDRFTGNFKLQYVRNENDGAIQHSDLFCGANGIADPIVLFGNPGAGAPSPVAIPAGYDCNAFDGKYFLPDAAPALSGGVPTPSKAAGRNGVPFGETDVLFGRLQFDFDATDYLTLTSVTGYLDMDAVDFDIYSYGGIGPAFSPLPAPSPPFPAGSQLPITLLPFPALNATNGPGVPFGVGGSDPRNTLQQVSQELRLASDFDGAINFMFGGFYEWRKFVFDTAQQAVNFSFIIPDPVTGFTYDWDKVHTTKTEAYSLFGSVVIDLSDQLELSGGLRWTDETKTQTISIPYMHAIPTGSGFAPSGFFSGPINFSDSNWSPEVTLKYQATDDVNIFASFKTGFKSGGIDNSALPSNSLLDFGSPDPAVREAAANGLIYQSETAIGGEIGVKSQFNDRTLTLNATAYYYVFDDLQVQNFDAVNIQFITQNAGEVTTKGVDLGWNWITPADGLSLSGNIAWLDAKFTDTFLVGGTIDLDGRDVARAPTWSGNLAFDWGIPVGNTMEMGLSGNAAYSDSYHTNNGLVTFIQDSYVTFDGSVSIGDADGKWKLALVGVNLTDEIFVTSAGGRPFLPGPTDVGVIPGDDIIISQNRGRQVYVEASFKF
ncbi:TonB-dependent receptor [Altererythrobacter arenosus]|uniref:TonB-dependent receptor n=1 Tax=Altererythrobacter arenosus TaxID=3032592 RepID=A0ABY8FRM6_9SPHN|nr:TonB-dependent receptor [Altererythrobacter sp. CAU 1644]WFL77667.1 TonB-dependent receptor [Altererythrobacter sp. CAU 1644]